MAESIIADNKDSTTELMRHYAHILANFKQRMPLRKAEREFNLENGELRAAIDNGLIRYYKAGKTQYRVCYEFVAEYVEKHCTFQNEPLPG